MKEPTKPHGLHIVLNKTPIQVQKKKMLFEESGVKNSSAKLTKSLSGIVASFTNKGLGCENVTCDKAKKSLRNAMGEYIPQKGGKPLTQLAIPLPGPADYSPVLSLTKKSTPQYSIAGKSKQLSVDEFPGPDVYHTEGDVVWRDRGFPMIGKGKPKRYDTCTVGPAAYMVQYNNFGSSKSKWAIGNRPEVIHGPPDRTVQPVDTFRFKTPGPAEYRPCSSHWRKNIKKSFGLALKKNKEIHDDDVPGPASYDVQMIGRGPAYSLGKRFPPSIGNANPGPGAFQIDTTIGKAVSKSMSSRNPGLPSMWTPSPNTYTVPSRIGEAPKYSMTYRSFESKVELKPSAASYKPTLKHLKRAAEYSCRRNCRPVYPDVLDYAEYNTIEPGMCDPEKVNAEITKYKNDAPAYSMGRHFQEKHEDTPGPASYNVKCLPHPRAKRAPTYSIGVRIDTKSNTVGPGPAAYYPNKISASPMYSMTGRHYKQKVSDIPAANAYKVHSGQTNRGTSFGSQPTLKGRPSPFLYSGFRRVTAK